MLEMVRKGGVIYEAMHAFALWIIPYLLILSFFVLPLTNSMRSIVFPISAIVILFTPYYYKQLLLLIKQPYAYIFLTFMAWILLACLWSPATQFEQFPALIKYSKLLLLPLFALGLQDDWTREKCINAIIIAALIPCILSILNGWGIYSYHGIIDPGHVFVNHIATGFMLAFLSYVTFYKAFKMGGWQRFAYIMIGLLFGYQTLFINTGRTGYIVYFILMLILFIQIFSWKKALLIACIFSALFGLSYTYSPVMQSGFDELLSDVNNYRQNKDTSLGYRFQLHEYGKSLFYKHPIIGNGTGAYAYLFSQDKPTNSYVDNTLFAHPHSQFWLNLVEQGVVGLILLLAFFASLIVVALKTPHYGPLLLGFLVIFGLTCWSDAMLIGDAPIVHLLILFSALCWGELFESQRKIS